jgi:hypothetical protein
MKRYRLHKFLPGCVAVALLAAALFGTISPVAVQAAPDLYAVPTQPRSQSIAPPGLADESAASDISVRLDVSGANHYGLPNGLDVTVWGSEELETRLTWRGEEAIIPLSDGRYLAVITDINDPSIYNKGDGEFHPFPEDWVVEVLKGISHPNMHMGLTVYILPYPRSNLLVSSTSGREIYLSPHVLDIHPAVCAYIVAHELGHVFHNAYLPESSAQWNRYLEIRGITDWNVYSASAAHAYRPREIFAEDFRVLFGGEQAAFGGRIENPDLPSPIVVPGLVEFVRGIGGELIAGGAKVLASSYPNPFNPETEIRVVIPDQIVQARERVTVRIYDVRGALVRELYSDVPVGENLYVRWDGRDRYGNAVASSHYFALIEAGSSRATLKLVLLK